MSSDGPATSSVGSALAVPDVGLEHYNRAVKVPVQEKPCPEETHSQQDMQEFKDVLRQVGLELDAEEWIVDATHQTKLPSSIREHMEKLYADCQSEKWDWGSVEHDHNPQITIAAAKLEAIAARNGKWSNQMTKMLTANCKLVLCWQQHCRNNDVKKLFLHYQYGDETTRFRYNVDQKNFIGFIREENPHVPRPVTNDMDGVWQPCFLLGDGDRLGCENPHCREL